MLAPAAGAASDPSAQFNPRYSGKGDTTRHDAPPLQSAGRIGSGAARRYHLVAVTPLDLGAMLTAERP
jgi:hypothetical protein